MVDVLIFMEDGELALTCSELLEQKNTSYSITQDYYADIKSKFIVADGKIGGAGFIYEYTSRMNSIKSLLFVERKDDIWIAKWSGATLMLMHPSNLSDIDEALSSMVT